MKHKISIIMLLVCAIFTGSVVCLAETNDEQTVGEDNFADLYYSAAANLTWGEHMWESPYGPLRELASDNICKLPEEKTTLTVPEGTDILKPEDTHAVQLTLDEVAELNLPESLKKIEEGALDDLWSMQSITIPSHVTEVPSVMFKKCENLRTIQNLSSQTLHLPDTDVPVLHWYEESGWPMPVFSEPGLEYYVDGEKTTEVPPGKTAVGVAKSFPLTYHLNGGKLVGKKVNSYRYGEPETILPKAKRKGYIFLGWSFNKKRTDYWTWQRLYNENGAILGGKTLTARWAKIRVKKTGKNKIQIRVYNRSRDDYQNNDVWHVACLYSTKKSMEGAKLACFDERFKNLKKKERKVNGKKTKDYKVTYYPKSKLLTVDLKHLKKGKTYYLQFRRMYRRLFPQSNNQRGPGYLNKKALKTFKVKL